MHTLETFKPIYEAFLESNLSVRDFCKQVEMPEGRFYYWQKRIRHAASQVNGEFLPVSINNHTGKVVLMGNSQQQGNVRQSLHQPSCEIQFPNGVTVRFNGDIPTSTLRELITLGR